MRTAVYRQMASADFALLAGTPTPLPRSVVNNLASDYGGLDNP